jgi:CheY-like chemotaxis protein
LEVVTTALWDKWQATLQEPRAGPEVAALAQEKLARSEIERLQARATGEAVDSTQLLNDLRVVVEPLSKVRKVAVHFNAFSHLAGLYADRVMLRQAILNIMTYALDIISEGQLEVGSFAERGERGLRVTASAKSIAVVPQRQGVGLEISQALMQEMGGALYLESEENECWEARLAWPMTVSPLLLVIDDYEDFAELFRRYLAAYHWQVIGATDGAMAQQLIAETRPTVIVLDVMMPKEDGWELLIAFKTNEATRNIPIFICSVLNEPGLALSLGAGAYLQKPITQEALLEALATVGLK